MAGLCASPQRWTSRAGVPLPPAADDRRKRCALLLLKVFASGCHRADASRLSKAQSIPRACREKRAAYKTINFSLAVLLAGISYLVKV